MTKMISQGTDVKLNSTKSRSEFRILWLPTFFCLFLIAIETHLLFTDRYFTSSVHEQNLGQPIATYTAGKNQVRKKAQGTLVWETPTAAAPLYGEDAIATMEDSEATLVFNDQSELVVEPNSLVILEKAPVGMKTGAIIARIVKGSIQHKKTGSLPFFVKLSRAKDAAPIEFADNDGRSVFRVIYKISGYDVMVESGSIVVDQKEIVTPTTGLKASTLKASKLKAPRLNKPKVEIQEDSHSQSPRHWNFFIETAEASETKKIRIHFSWEPIPEATSYRIQVSKDPTFGQIFREAEVPLTAYQFLLRAPDHRDELYFRVAGVDRSGNVGDFSSVEKIEINPVEVAAVPLPTPRPVARPPTQARSEGSLPAPIVTRIVRPKSDHTVHFWLAYGAAYDWRDFKNSAASPNDSSGGGVLPSKLMTELRVDQDRDAFFNFHAAATLEQASPTLVSPSNTAVSVTAYRFWATYGDDLTPHHKTSWVYEVGPYVTNSSKFVPQGLLYTTSSVWLGGVLVSLQDDLEELLASSSLGWRFELGLIPIGTLGLDAHVIARRALIHDGLFRGLFAQIDLGTRQTGIETSYQGSLELGFWR